MRRKEILDAVREVVVRELGCGAPVEEGSDLLADLQLDSVQRLTLSVELENRFALCFDPDEEVQAATVGDVVDMIERALAGGRADAVPA